MPGSQIVVIGGGVAGLSAAVKLGSHGRKVVLLEAQGRCGGRVYSVQAGERTYDMGASWLHDIEHNPLYEIAKYARWPMRSETQQNFVMLDARSEPVKEVLDVTRKLEAAREIVHKIGDDASVFDMSLKEYVDKYVDAESRLAFRAYEFFAGLPWTQMSAVETAPDLLDHGTDAFQLGGNDRLVEWLLKKCNANVTVRLNTPATSVSLDSSTGRVVVRTASGERIDCSRAVVALPLGFLKKHVDAFFLSPLPTPLYRAISTATIACLGKAVLEFGEQFWDPSMGRVVVVIGDATVMLSNVYKDTPGPPVLLAFVPGPLGVELERCSKNAVAAWRLLRPACAALAAGRAVPEPTGVLVSRWSQHPYILGAYSSLSVGQNMRDLVLPMMQGAWDDRLLFAGEHSTIQGIGCVDGAYVSGIAAADKIMQC